MGIPGPDSPPSVVPGKIYWVQEIQFADEGCMGESSTMECCVSSETLQNYGSGGDCTAAGMKVLCYPMKPGGGRMLNCIGPFDTWVECLEAGCW